MSEIEDEEVNSEWLTENFASLEKSLKAELSPLAKTLNEMQLRLNKLEKSEEQVGVYGPKALKLAEPILGDRKVAEVFVVREDRQGDLPPAKMLRESLNVEGLVRRRGIPPALS